MTPSRLTRILNVLDARTNDLFLLLDHVHKQRNHAAALRSCDAMGLQSMHVVGKAEEHRAFSGTAMGSHRWVDVFHHDTIEHALRFVREKGMQLLVASGERCKNVCDRASLVHYKEVDYCQPTAIVMGAENSGPSDASIASADAYVYIPIAGMVESLNVSVAAAILVNEAREQRLARAYEAGKLSKSERQRLMFLWGYPRLAALCLEKNLPLPIIDDNGDIQDVDHEWRRLVNKNLSNQ